VTKTYGVDVINQAIDCGVGDIGENRVQEILEKYPAVKPVRWHLIGHLQKNKVKYIIDKVEFIHSVDSFELAKEIDKQAKKIDKVQKILLEVNVSGEESKFGISVDECEALCTKISAELSNVKIEGLMTVAPYTNDAVLLENVFKGLKNLAAEIALKNIKNVDMKELSMGMTNDFEIAIKNGSTMVRVGTGIFGKRDYTNR
jgi:pyridoxal phosphate enzyme (YggS family)